MNVPSQTLPSKRGGEISRGFAVAVLMLAVGACGPFCGNGKLNLSHGNLNPASFTCPVGVTDYKYDIKGTLDADNETGKKITVKSMATAAEVVKLVGNWGIAVGDKSGAEKIDFSPKTLDSGSKTTFKFTTPWNCTDDGNNTTETYADFKIQLVIVTDNGTYKVDLPTHRMKMA
jgi:hypothetical protein